MKKVLLLLISLFTAFALLAGAAHAQLENVCNIEGDSDLCAENEATQGRGGSRGLYGEGGLLTNIANGVSLVTGVAAIVALMIGGFRYIRSSGDASNIGNAQQTIIYAIIGMIVAATAQLLVVFVLNRTPTP